MRRRKDTGERSFEEVSLKEPFPSRHCLFWRLAPRRWFPQRAAAPFTHASTVLMSSDATSPKTASPKASSPEPTLPSESSSESRSDTENCPDVENRPGTENLSGGEGLPEAASPASSSDIVVKANQLIRGRINWTKLEHRVVAMLVAQLKQEDDAFEMQKVHISDLMDLSQTSSRDIYNRAEEVCRKLLRQKVHVRTQTEDGRRMYQGYNCLSTCRYVEGSGYIEAKFNDDMKPFLLELKRQFTMYRLQNFMQLGSQHSMRTYELIKMREGLRHLCLSVEELREVLCCKHTYDRFSDFRRHVLERARTEIKETCDVYYTYMVERDGRTPVRVRFLIHRREEDGPAPLMAREENVTCSGGASGEDTSDGDTPDGDTSSGGAPSGGASYDDSASRSGTRSDNTSCSGSRGDDASRVETSRGEAGGEDGSYVESRGPSGEKRKASGKKRGASGREPACPLRAAERRYDLYVTVLSRLPQEILDGISRSTVQSVLEAGRDAARPTSTGDDPRAVAEQVVEGALSELQA